VGSEKLPLPIDISLQYWVGSGFATNTLDSCTTIPRSTLALDFTPVSALAACETSVGNGAIGFTAGVPAGAGNLLTLAAPGAGNNGSVLLTANLVTAAGSYCNPSSYVAAGSAGLRYLLGRWNDAANPDGDATTMYDDNPKARAAFGLYGTQPNNFVYMRENY
jgi:MSHA biogenesis protein MshQ